MSTHISSTKGATEKAVPTVRAETVPAEVVTAFVSTLNSSFQLILIEEPCALDLKFAAISFVVTATAELPDPVKASGIKAPLKYLVPVITVPYVPA